MLRFRGLAAKECSVCAPLLRGEKTLPKVGQTIQILNTERARRCQMLGLVEDLELQHMQEPQRRPQIL